MHWALCWQGLGFFERPMTSNFIPQDYPSEPRLRDLPIRPQTIPRIPLLGLIRVYQATVARALPANTCRFYPSCSHYGYQAIYRHGVLKGSLLAIWRLLRCNPFNPGGYDPVPDTFQMTKMPCHEN